MQDEPNIKFKIHHSSLAGQGFIIHHFKNHPQATLILLAFIVLAVIYSLITPPFEAGDESRHYAVVKYMVDSGRLITQNVPETETIQHHWSHEGNQPPLYYTLAAGLTFWIDEGDWNDVFWYNPHTTIGNPLRPDNKNITIHRPAEPWRGHVLAVHLIRFLSIAMAAVTVLACYTIALSLFKDNRRQAAGAMAITAFNPMFIFISSSVNNDNAVIMFVTLALWLMVYLALNYERLTNKQMLGYAILLGALIGLGALSKLYAFGLLPIAGGLFIWLAYRQTSQRAQGGFVTRPPVADQPGALASDPHPPISQSPNPQSPIATAITWITLFGLAFLLIAGWFYLRNALLYNGDVLALKVMRETAGQRQTVPSPATLRAEFEGFRIAYWALFGGVNILADTWIYPILDWISLIAAIGVIAFIFYASRITHYASRITHHALRITYHASRISLPTFILLLTWYLIMIAGFIAWNITQPAGQGRLLYPAISAISALGMLGLTWWLPAGGQKIVAGLCTVGLFLFAALAPFLYIYPAYAKPSILAESELPADIQPVGFIYDDTIRLLGYQLHPDPVRPAQTLPITLYWQ
ncbi:MAG: glycosyltransferase family 39 protein, partial [Rhodobacteraceae bacterium]|nr:glycosyltransferase family 39 protein [Paracoccaceae bacterium]